MWLSPSGQVAHATLDWRLRRTGIFTLRKLVKEMIEGTSTILKINVLEIDEDIVNRAEGFMMHAVKYKFGSQDALIASTAIIHSTEENPMYVVTADKALRAAMKDEGMEFIVPGKAR